MNISTIELGDSNGIAITKNGKVVAFIKVKRDTERGVELVGQSVNRKTEWNDSDTFNQFAVTLGLEVTRKENDSSIEFISALEGAF